MSNVQTEKNAAPRSDSEETDLRSARPPERQQENNERDSEHGALVLGQAAVYLNVPEGRSSAGIRPSFLRRLVCPSAGRKTEPKKNKH